MRLTYARMALATVLACTVMGGFTAAYAQTTSEDNKFDVTLKDADLAAATRTITNRTGLQFIFEQNDQPWPRVTVSLTGVTGEDAVRYVCQSAGVYFHRDENGVFIISRNKPAAPVTPDPITTQPSVAPKKKLHKFRLQKADAEQVFFSMTHQGVAFDPYHGFKDMKDFQNLASPASQMGESPSRVIIPGLTTGQGNQTYTPISSQNFNPPTTKGTEGSNDIELPGESSRQGGLAGGGEGGGGFGNRQGGGGLGGGQGGGAAGGQAQLGTGGLIPAGITYITYDPTDNSIVVQATDEQIKDLQEAISLFDVAPQQVQIKVQFVTTSASTTKHLGFDWLYTRGTVAAGTLPGTFATSGDPVFLNFATGNISTRLKALLADGTGKTVSSPVVRTLNNQAAFVTQGTQTTIFINQTIAIGNGNVITQSIPLPITVSTTLAVRPRINNDGTITMFLNPSITDLGQIRTGPDGNQVPDVLFQQIAVVARVKDGDTIALAGLTRRSETSSGNRFPILSDLPIIGQFFRQTNKEKDYSELLVFVTPTVIQDDDVTPP